jgi:hypothetical protein
VLLAGRYKGNSADRAVIHAAPKEREDYFRFACGMPTEEERLADAGAVEGKTLEDVTCAMCSARLLRERKDETFWFGPVGWDVGKARDLLTLNAREPIELKVEELDGQLSFVHVDEAYAKTVPMDEPIILGHYPPTIEPLTEGKQPMLVIDGHHRLWRATHEKRPTIRVYVLTAEENRLIEKGSAWGQMRRSVAAKARKGAAR